MNTVKAKNRVDEPVTQEVLAQAIVRGKKRGVERVLATAVKYVAQLDCLLFSFVDHSGVALPVRNYPELAVLSETELQSLYLGFGGSSLCLDARDMHVSIAGLVAASQPLMEMASSLIAVRNGSKSSALKAAAAKRNGSKGGRPRLDALAA